VLGFRRSPAPKVLELSVSTGAYTHSAPERLPAASPLHGDKRTSGVVVLQGHAVNPPVLQEAVVEKATSPANEHQ